jgi:hypothetical protein
LIFLKLFFFFQFHHLTFDWLRTSLHAFCFFFFFYGVIPILCPYTWG